MLLNTLSRYGCRQIPTPSNLQLLQQIAKYELCVKPTAAVAAIHAGIPSIHSAFWNNLTVQDVQSLYKSLTVTASRVLGILQFPEPSTHAEERILGYLSNMIGNMNDVQLQNFLRFVTGSSVVLGKDIPADCVHCTHRRCNEYTLGWLHVLVDVLMDMLMV